MLAIHFAEVMNSYDVEKLNEIKNELLGIPSKIEKIFENIEPIKEYAKAGYDR